MSAKIKLLTISDHPLVASGVGIQTRYIIEGLLKTGDYEICSLGGAMHHKDYRPVKLDTWQDNWIIWPIDGYGNPDLLRQALDSAKIDALWFMTDPRFYYWLFGMMDEVSDRGVAVLYNHVWDEYPAPQFNKQYYQSCDFVGCISRLTQNILNDLGLSEIAEYIPHAADANIFKPLNLSLKEMADLKLKILGPNSTGKTVFFYNSRNALRKRTSDVISGFKLLVDQVGEDKVFLFMHTDPTDQEGANLHSVCQMYGLTDKNVAFSTQGQPPEVIAQFYNISDVLVNISSNEGFGLSCLEALSCGKLAIVNMTGGLKDQIKDHEGNVFGVAIEPLTKSLNGSQHIPYIYDCRVSHEQLKEAMLKMHNMHPTERQELGKKAREWSLQQFSMQAMIDKWDKAIKKQVEKKRCANKTLQVANL